MEKGKDIGKITLEIDKKQLESIVNSGRLENFIETATTLFNRDLKANLVEASVSSVSTGLFLIDDDEYGTGPRPPHWWNIGKIDTIIKRIDQIEKTIGINEEILDASSLSKIRGG